MLTRTAVITTPMDLQTMQKKVKQRHYKSKREFKDDLDLIWSNCYQYNATEVSNSVRNHANPHHHAIPSLPNAPPRRTTLSDNARRD